MRVRLVKKAGLLKMLRCANFCASAKPIGDTMSTFMKLAMVSKNSDKSSSAKVGTSVRSFISMTLKAIPGLGNDSDLC